MNVSERFRRMERMAFCLTVFTKCLFFSYCGFLSRFNENKMALMGSLMWITLNLEMTLVVQAVEYNTALFL